MHFVEHPLHPNPSAGIIRFRFHELTLWPLSPAFGRSGHPV